MSSAWKTTIFKNEDEAFDKFLELSGKKWLCRGHKKKYNSLVPMIDREPFEGKSRIEKLSLERRSISLFRSTARFFSHPGEEGALVDDFITLMVLRHHGIPTRLLDWSMSPYVAAYFAASGHLTKGGELWSFDGRQYAIDGQKQWKKWPQTTTDGSGDADKFDAKLTAFTNDEPPNWFICAFYPLGFHRQNAQHGAYTCTARFDRDHADAIAGLLKGTSRYHRFVIPAKLKKPLLRRLQDCHGISRLTLLPDCAGATETAQTPFEEQGWKPCRASASDNLPGLVSSELREREPIRHFHKTISSIPTRTKPSTTVRYRKC